MLWKFGHLLFCPFGAHSICWLLHVALKNSDLCYLMYNNTWLFKCEFFVICQFHFCLIGSLISHKCWSAIKFIFSLLIQIQAALFIITKICRNGLFKHTSVKLSFIFTPSFILLNGTAICQKKVIKISSFNSEYNNGSLS